MEGVEIVRVRGQFYIATVVFFLVAFMVISVVITVFNPMIITEPTLVIEETKRYNFKVSSTVVGLKEILAGVTPKVVTDPNTGKPIFSDFEWDEAYLWNFINEEPELYWILGSPPPSIKLDGFMVFRYIKARQSMELTFMVISDPISDTSQYFLVVLDFIEDVTPEEQNHLGLALLFNLSGGYLFTFDLNYNYSDLLSNPTLFLETYDVKLTPQPSYTTPEYADSTIAFKITYIFESTLRIEEKYGYENTYELLPLISNLDNRKFSIYMYSNNLETCIDSIIVKLTDDQLKEELLRVSRTRIRESQVVTPLFEIINSSISQISEYSSGTCTITIEHSPYQTDDIALHRTTVTSVNYTKSWTSSVLVVSKNLRFKFTKTYNVEAYIPSTTTDAYRTSTLVYFYVVKLPLKLVINHVPISYYSYYIYTHFKVITDKPTQLMPFVSFIEVELFKSEGTNYIIHLAIPEDVINDEVPFTLYITTPEGVLLKLNFVSKFT